MVWYQYLFIIRRICWFLSKLMLRMTFEEKKPLTSSIASTSFNCSRTSSDNKNDSGKNSQDFCHFAELSSTLFVKWLKQILWVILMFDQVDLQASSDVDVFEFDGQKLLPDIWGDVGKKYWLKKAKKYIDESITSRRFKSNVLLN